MPSQLFQVCYMEIKPYSQNHTEKSTDEGLEIAKNAFTNSVRLV
jgi:hypothetical protein